jgi:glycerol uptake facilitator-like aquaporin
LTAEIVEAGPGIVVGIGLTFLAVAVEIWSIDQETGMKHVIEMSIEDVGVVTEMVGEIAIVKIGHGVVAEIETAATILKNGVKEACEKAPIEMIDVRRRVLTVMIVVIVIAPALVTIDIARNHLDPVVSETMSQRKTVVDVVVPHSAENLSPLKN